MTKAALVSLLDIEKKKVQALHISLVQVNLKEKSKALLFKKSFQ